MDSRSQEASEFVKRNILERGDSVLHVYDQISSLKLLSNTTLSYRNYFVVPKLKKTKSFAKKDSVERIEEDEH